MNKYKATGDEAVLYTRYYPKARTKTVSMSLETKPKKFPCIKILSSVELKREKTFLPLNIINIINILIDLLLYILF